MKTPEDRILERIDRIYATGFARFRLDQLADDVGRLRRHLDTLVDEYADTLTAAYVDRIARHVETLHADRRAPAAHRYRALVDEGLAPAEALARALAEVDREAEDIRRRLGLVS